MPKDSRSDEKWECDNIHLETVLPKTNKNGIVLIPKPSDSLDDPLNWPTTKKISTLAIVSLAAYASVLSSQCNAAGFAQQAVLYQKSMTQVSYSLTASGLGLAFGPFLWSPLTSVTSKSALIFYSMLLAAFCNVWTARMTDPGHYAGFVVSRLFAALLGSSATVVGSSIITDVFFLHDRGKCFAAFTASILIGSASAATFSGFITQSASWTVQFWYNVGLEGLIALLCLAILDDTNYLREEGHVVPTVRPGFLARIGKTYFATRKDTSTELNRGIVRRAKILGQACICPSTLIVGFSILISFSWAVGVSATLSIFLQSPTEEGGYGFTPFQNACYSFTTWAAVICAQLYGTLVNDKIPLLICSRRGGYWIPEYRLYPVALPMLILGPTGLGLFGASLFYHLHYTVIAGASFLLNFADVAMLSPLQTYVVESIGPTLATEVITILNFYRLILGGLVPLFIFPWIAEVGANWTFGTMAFLMVTAFCIMAGVMVWGEKLRKLNSFQNEDEDWVKVTSPSKAEEKT
ncbi:major facilitator superfamily domain-containing protein [Xylogone sp. PMI_703]|nr:major facilitator superfamily domain-containing protein [Xylogone sp. PMI_703]